MALSSKFAVCAATMVRKSAARNGSGELAPRPRSLAGRVDRAGSIDCGVHPIRRARPTRKGGRRSLVIMRAETSIMRRSLRLAVLAFGASLLAGAGTAEAQQKLVVYSANDSTLNDLVFAAFG